MGADKFCDDGQEITCGDFGVVAGLEINPEIGCCGEENGQACGGVASDGTAAMDDVVDATGRDVDGAGELILADTGGGEEFFEENLAGRDGG